MAWGGVSDPLKRRHTAFVYGNLDELTMKSALQCMMGTHDFEAFSNLRPDDSSTTRTITKARMVMMGPHEARIEV